MATEIKINADTRAALENAWDVAAAGASMDRWITVCSREGWGTGFSNLPLLARLFGASWYFTRLVFFRGPQLAKYFDNAPAHDFSLDTLRKLLERHLPGDDLERRLDQLRNNKNEIMLQIFLAQLKSEITQAQAEQALTRLAECTLQVLMSLLAGEQHDPSVFGVLAMGRMAGDEMNYGSDLDLIILYDDRSVADSSALGGRIRRLLRHIATPSSCGILYEIDMRLRPYGTSGTLISPAGYFVEYHRGAREIWERQMMTRCRPVMDPQGLAERSIQAVIPSIYGDYDETLLKTEIIAMRKKVQHELGSPRHKFEIKRGSGGIMDIDFMTHYLQLLHGSHTPRLRTASTRNALRELEDAQILNHRQARELLEHYDFLKTIEGVLRVKDMKNISVFPDDPDAVATLARAMGYGDDNRQVAGEKFIRRYTQVTNQVRRYFNELVGQMD